MAVGRVVPTLVTGSATSWDCHYRCRLRSCTLKMIPSMSKRCVHLIGVTILFVSALAFFLYGTFSGSDLCHKLSIEKLSWEDKWFTKPSNYQESCRMKESVLLVCGGLFGVAMVPLMRAFRNRDYLPQFFIIFPGAVDELMNTIINFMLLTFISVVQYLYRQKPEKFLLDPTPQYLTINGHITECFTGYGAFVWFGDILFLYTSIFTGMIYQSLVNMEGS